MLLQSGITVRPQYMKYLYDCDMYVALMEVCGGGYDLPTWVGSVLENALDHLGAGE